MLCVRSGEEQRKHEEGEEFGERNTTHKHDPQERTEHELTHLPFT